MLTATYHSTDTLTSDIIVSSKVTKEYKSKYNNKDYKYKNNYIHIISNKVLLIKLLTPANNKYSNSRYEEYECNDESTRCCRWQWHDTNDGKCCNATNDQ